MNKKELIEAVSTKTGLTKKDTGIVLDSFIETIGEALNKGDVVRLVGFGTFMVANRKQRRGVNPRTKQSIMIPGGRVPKFVAGKDLKDKVS
ncbi:MAG TPA: integration host factor [Kosmotogaceae bacterium]|nr:MAG: Bacterial nucleoid DNA-binding protein [Thermotogales bacterium 46_20]HAA85895.1 integration host factor [Kosmotogaceae bacterium]